ncbi:MAG: BLUF domain-containing protein [Phycisphaerales bacterium]|nr:BLUF domain-containing protein [Phycisphaerales bacterium]MCB9862775.1 BLUF domain-containing protein [Phycisphaerales bacterium]
MSIFQLVYLSRLKQAEVLDGVPITPQRPISGLVLYKAPSVLHVMEGEACDLCRAYEHVCKDPRHEDVHCILFRPVARRMFVGFETRVIDGRNVEDHPRPIDLWAALNLESPDDAQEASRQVREAIVWFGGRSIPHLAGAESGLVGSYGVATNSRLPRCV